MGGVLTITSNPLLSALDLAGLGNVTGAILISDNQKLPGIDLSGLSTFSNGSLQVDNNDELTTLVLPGAGLVKSLILYGNSILQSVNLNVLPAVMTQLYLGHPSGAPNNQLSDIGSKKLSQLEQLTGTFYIANNASLPAVDLNRLWSVGSNFTITRNPVLGQHRLFRQRVRAMMGTKLGGRLMRNIHALVVVGLLLLPMFAEATEQWYPSQGVFATWAFEDNWPSMGDYDFNDLVVDYRIHMVGDGGSPERVREMDIVTRFKARGATFHSGFGISVPVDPGILTAGLSPTKIGCPFQVNRELERGTANWGDLAHRRCP